MKKKNLRWMKEMKWLEVRNNMLVPKVDAPKSVWDDYRAYLESAKQHTA